MTPRQLSAARDQVQQATSRVAAIVGSARQMSRTGALFDLNRQRRESLRLELALAVADLDGALLRLNEA